jgi:heme exporter protein D
LEHPNIIDALSGTYADIQRHEQLFELLFNLSYFTIYVWLAAEAGVAMVLTCAHAVAAAKHLGAERLVASKTMQSLRLIAPEYVG